MKKLIFILSLVFINYLCFALPEVISDTILGFDKTIIYPEVTNSKMPFNDNIPIKFLTVDKKSIDLNNVYCEGSWTIKGWDGTYHIISCISNQNSILEIGWISEDNIDILTNKDWFATVGWEDQYNPSTSAEDRNNFYKKTKLPLFSTLWFDNMNGCSVTEIATGISLSQFGRAIVSDVKTIYSEKRKGLLGNPYVIPLPIDNISIGDGNLDDKVLLGIYNKILEVRDDNIPVSAGIPNIYYFYRKANTVNNNEAGWYEEHDTACLSKVNINISPNSSLYICLKNHRDAEFDIPVYIKSPFSKKVQGNNSKIITVEPQVFNKIEIKK